MRLRNKKTGEIILEAEIVVRTRSPEEDEGETLAYDAHGEFTSLAELDENWEDYEPVGPLIKDEKKRKAFQAWLEACEISKTAAIKYEGSGRFRKAFKLIDFDTSWNEPGIKPGSFTGVQLIGEDKE